MEALDRRSIRPVAMAPMSASRITKFVVVGLLGVVVNSLSLSALHQLAHLGLIPASALSTEMAILSNFVLHDRWTFGRRDWRPGRLARFNVTSFANLIVTVATVWLLADRVGVHYLVANLMAIGGAGILNFLASATWVWGAGETELRRDC